MHTWTTCDTRRNMMKTFEKKAFMRARKWIHHHVCAHIRDSSTVYYNVRSVRLNLTAARAAARRDDAERIVTRRSRWLWLLIVCYYIHTLYSCYYIYVHSSLTLCLCVCWPLRHRRNQTVKTVYERTRRQALECHAQHRATNRKNIAGRGSHANTTLTVYSHYL